MVYIIAFILVLWLNGRRLQKQEEKNKRTKEINAEQRRRERKKLKAMENLKF